MKNLLDLSYGFYVQFQKLWLKASTRNDTWYRKLKFEKTWKKKSKLFGHVIDYALHCSKIITNDSHHLPNE